ncbi:nucleotidyltransferase domain-containing protein [Streptomyces sp. AD16]|nr:nucleotidyltransferase domain-containing protein [Streptomyces sp. AD16]
MTALPQTPDPTSAPAASARRLVEARYGDGLGAVLGGSAAGGRFTARSDLDIAVLLPEGGRDRRRPSATRGDAPRSSSTPPPACAPSSPRAAPTAAPPWPSSTPAPYPCTTRTDSPPSGAARPAR